MTSLSTVSWGSTGALSTAPLLPDFQSILQAISAAFDTPAGLVAVPETHRASGAHTGRAPTSVSSITHAPTSFDTWAACAKEPFMTSLSCQTVCVDDRVSGAPSAPPPPPSESLMADVLLDRMGIVMLPDIGLSDALPSSPYAEVVPIEPLLFEMRPRTCHPASPVDDWSDLVAPPQHAPDDPLAIDVDTLKDTNESAVWLRLAGLRERLTVLKRDPSLTTSDESLMLESYMRDILGDTQPHRTAERLVFAIESYLALCGGLCALESWCPGSVAANPWPPTPASALPALGALVPPLCVRPPVDVAS